MAQAGEARRQAPARLQLPALGGAAVQGEDPPLARLGGVEGDLQPVAEQTAGATVVVRLGGRQQMDEGGVALHHRTHQGGETRVGEGEAVLQPGDQRALGGDDARRCGDRQALQEGRIAGDLGVVGGPVRGAAESGWARCLAAVEESHADMLHPSGTPHGPKTTAQTARFHDIPTAGSDEAPVRRHRKAILCISFC